MLARCDAGNPVALKKLVAGGTHLRPCPRAVMEACYRASPRFAKIHDHHADRPKVD